MRNLLPSSVSCLASVELSARRFIKEEEEERRLLVVAMPPPKMEGLCNHSVSIRPLPIASTSSAFCKFRCNDKDASSSSSSDRILLLGLVVIIGKFPTLVERRFLGCVCPCLLDVGFL